jgi:hypothetical protein
VAGCYVHIREPSMKNAGNFLIAERLPSSDWNNTFQLVTSHLLFPFEREIL